MLRLINRRVYFSAPPPPLWSTGEFVSGSGLEYVVLEVPYEGGAVSMFLVQPFEADVPASALTAELSSRRIAEWDGELRSVKRRLALPR